MNWRILLPVLFLCFEWVTAQEFLELPIGDPQRKDRQVTLSIDTITDTRADEKIAPQELIERLSDVQVLFLGESHTNYEVHQIQRRVIEALSNTGRTVIVGLEMFPYTEQEHLQHWARGLLTEKGFLELAKWYENWGYNWNYYREIFTLLRDREIPTYAVNIPRSIVSAVRRVGFDGLSEDQRGQLPDEIDTESEDHLRLFKAFFGDGASFHASMTDEQWKGLFHAQCTWDAAMAHYSLKALQEHQTGQEPIMVVLIGSGHVAYNLGIQRQAARRFKGRMASLIAFPIPQSEKSEEKSEGEHGHEQSGPEGEHDGERSELRLQASYADFLWGVPEEEYERYPSLGVSTRTDEETGQIRVLFVQKDSAAAEAGIEAGDVLTELDGDPFTHRSQLNAIIATKYWGDSMQVTRLREDSEERLRVYFRRR